MFLAYFAPETILPATSALATVAEFLLLFGKRATRPVVRFLRRTVRLDPPPSRNAPAIPSPHLPGFRPAAGDTEGRQIAAPWNRRVDS